MKIPEEYKFAGRLVDRRSYHTQEFLQKVNGENFRFSYGIALSIKYA